MRALLGAHCPSGTSTVPRRLPFYAYQTVHVTFPPVLFLDAPIIRFGCPPRIIDSATSASSGREAGIPCYVAAPMQWRYEARRLPPMARWPPVAKHASWWRGHDRCGGRLEDGRRRPLMVVTLSGQEGEHAEREGGARVHKQGCDAPYWRPELHSPRAPSLAPPRPQILTHRDNCRYGPRRWGGVWPPNNDQSAAVPRPTFQPTVRGVEQTDGPCVTPLEVLKPPAAFPVPPQHQGGQEVPFLPGWICTN